MPACRWQRSSTSTSAASRRGWRCSGDNRDLTRWHAEAAVRAEEAGFDILYIYAGHLPYHFLILDYNQRTDAYGGSVANRVRLLAQLIDAVRDAKGAYAATILRWPDAPE